MLCKKDADYKMYITDNCETEYNKADKMKTFLIYSNGDR